MTYPLDQVRRRDGLAIVATVAALVVVALTLEIVLLIFAGTVLGVFLAESSRSLSTTLELPRTPLLATLLILIATLTTLAVVLLGPTVVEQLRALAERLPEVAAAAATRIEHYGIAPDMFAAIEDRVVEAAGGPAGAGLIEQGATLASRLLGMFSSTLGAVTAFVVVIVIALYVGFEPAMYYRGVLEVIPPPYRADTATLLDRLGRLLAWWFAGQALSMLVLGSAMTLGLWLLGIPFALVFGLFTAAMTFIPNLGPVIAAVPVLLVALTQEPSSLVYVALLVVVVQQVEGLLLTPLVHRRIIRLPPAVVLSTLLLLGTLAGFVGVLVAMPMSAVAIGTARFLIERRDQSLDAAA